MKKKGTEHPRGLYLRANMVSLAAPKVSMPAGPRQIVQAHVTHESNSSPNRRKGQKLSFTNKKILKTQGSLAYAS